MSTSSFEPQRRRRPRRAAAVLARTAVVVALAGLLTAGCSLTLSSGDANPGSGAEGANSGGRGTAINTPGAGDASSTPAPGGEATPAGGGSEGAAQAGVPQDQNLDIEVIHPNGMTLSISRLSFKDNDIFLDVEAINSSRDEVSLYSGNYFRSRMRLVGDAGQEYNFVEGAEGQDIELVPGETLSGTLAFRGPLRGQPSQLSLVINLSLNEISGYRLEAQSDSDVSPSFLIPMDLVWE